MISKNEYLVPNRAESSNEKQNIIDRLHGLWLENPELRLGQLIGAAYPCGRSCPHCQQDVEHRDPFYVEDFDFINRLETALKKAQQ